MSDTAVKDQRGYFVLPQGYEGGGYYVYGTPDQGRSQYAHPHLLSFLLLAAARWAACDTRKFGVGNISLANGADHPDHAQHENGLEVDIRPLRKDGLHLPCDIHSASYDREGTAKLIRIFREFPAVKIIYFNDDKIPQVFSAKQHDNHFHLEVHG